MLIVEMEMPSFCASCFVRGYCRPYIETLYIIGAPIPTPKKTFGCLIKGEISEIELMHLEEERAFAARNIAAERKDDE